MKDFKQLFENDFKQTQADWEASLRTELKLEDISGKTLKKIMDLGPWPTLSLQAPKESSLSSQTKWKKASQTYIKIDPKKILGYLHDDLLSGVRVFFFYTEDLSQNVWNSIHEHFISFEHKDELEIYVLGSTDIEMASSLKVFDSQNFIDAREIHLLGGNSVHELAFLACCYIDHQDALAIGLHLDSHFFKNIARVRALKLILEKITIVTGKSKRPQVVALNSYREWTLFERYSNILRNNTQVASGLIAGAEVIQSSGYQVLFDLETQENDVTHNERSLRMARNTSHILSLESTLGIVEDAAYGSFHIENLSQRYAEEAWLLMQRLIHLSASDRLKSLNHEIQLSREERQERMKIRKDVFAGINDFPNVDEHLLVELKNPVIFRPSRILEELRLKVQDMKKRPQVQIHCHGEMASLNARVSFIKNYFEMIGLQVILGLQEVESRIIVLCAKDEDYLEFSKTIQNEKSLSCYVAGKIQVPGCESIHAGQNVYEVLLRLAQKMGAVV